MDLEKMLNAQKELDNTIIKKKNLKDVNLTPNTFLALQVELAEFANESRWFKHWSNNQTPRTKAVRNTTMMEEDKEYYNPQLDEFADCTHFFLSIANQKGWQDALFILEEQLAPDEFDGDVTGFFLEMTYFLNKSHFEVYKKGEEIAGFQKNEYWFRLAWMLFLNIGINGFGYTLNQIEQAYFLKNKINHQRQKEDY